MNLATLKKKAQRVTKQRGHAMRWGHPFGIAGNLASLNGSCRKCGLRAFLNSSAEARVWFDPARVGGYAIAANCGDI